MVLKPKNEVKSVKFETPNPIQESAVKDEESLDVVKSQTRLTCAPYDVFIVTMGFSVYSMFLTWFFIAHASIFDRPVWWGTTLGEWYGASPQRNVIQFLYLMELGSAIVCVGALVVILTALYFMGRLVPPRDSPSRTGVFLARLVVPVLVCLAILAFIVPLSLFVSWCELIVKCDCSHDEKTDTYSYSEGCKPTENSCYGGRAIHLPSFAMFMVAAGGLYAGCWMIMIFAPSKSIKGSCDRCCGKIDFVFSRCGELYAAE